MIKLDRGFFFLWQNLALPILRSYKLEGYLTGDKPCPPQFIQTTAAQTESTITEASSSTPTPPPVKTPNPLYEAWQVVDQLILRWLYNSMMAEVAIQVMGCANAQALWTAITELFGIQSHAEEDYLRQVFQEICKGSLKMADYLRLMKTHADSLGQADGSPNPSCSLISQQVLLGLVEEYNPIIAMIQRKLNISWSEVQGELLAFEKRLEFQQSLKTTQSFSQNTTVNMAVNHNWSGGNYRTQGNFSFNRGFSGHYNRGSNFMSPNRACGQRRHFYSNNSRPTCQFCGRFGHYAPACYNRLDKQYSNLAGSQHGGSGGRTQWSTSSPRFSSSTLVAYTATTNYNPFVASPESVMDPNWYADSGASTHVITAVSNVTNPSQYGGNTTVVVGNGSELDISHIGCSYLSSSHGLLKLDNILCVPDIAKNLVSVSKLARDNNFYIEFHAGFCLVKDKASDQVVLRGTLKDGLYCLHTGHTVDLSRRDDLQPHSVKPPLPAVYHVDRLSINDPMSLCFPSDVNVAVTRNLWHRCLGHPAKNLFNHLCIVVSFLF